MLIINYFIGMIVGSALVYDLFYRKIPNYLILTGYAGLGPYMYIDVIVDVVEHFLHRDAGVDHTVGCRGLCGWCDIDFHIYSWRTRSRGCETYMSYMWFSWA